MVRILNIKIKNQDKPIFCKKLILTYKDHHHRRRHRLEGHPLQVSHKKNRIVSLSKTVRSRASCGARCMGMLLKCGLRFVQRRHTRNSVKERDPVCAWTNRIA